MTGNEIYRANISEVGRMTARRFNVSGKMLFTWLLLGGLILLFSPESITDKLQLGFAGIFRWPLTAGRSIAPLTATNSEPLTNNVSRQEYDRLQNHLDNVIEQLYQERQKVESLSNLKKVKGIDNRFALEGASLVPAGIINSNMNNLTNELIINRGSDNGLEIGQFAMANNSIIGKISAVSEKIARVKLVTDPASSIPVLISLNSGKHIEAILKGTGSNKAKIDLVPAKNKVETANKIYAAKQPGVLDIPIKIGEIKQCRRLDENPLLWNITVKTACNFENIRDVAIIIMNPKP